MRCLLTLGWVRIPQGQRAERPLADALSQGGPRTGLRLRHRARVDAISRAGAMEELQLAPLVLLENPVEVCPAVP
eukprot:12786779-Alexandrium_andersonii.AAC.1